MKIGFMGVQGTGKSTIVNKLVEEGFCSSDKVAPSIGRTMKEKGFPINESGNDETQLLALQITCNQMYEPYNIYPRTFLDGLVYSKYLFEKGQIAESVLKSWEGLTAKHMKDFDVLFYIKPEFDLVADGDRSMNVEFRDRAAEIMGDYINKFGWKYIQLTGDVESRMDTVHKSLGGKIESV